MTDATTLVRMPPMYAKQHKAVSDKARYSVIEASTKSGKTLGCLIWQGARVMRDTQAMNHWWVAPYYGQANIAYNRAKRMFRGVCQTHEQEKRLSFTNGAIWWFKSGEKPDALYGEDVADVVIDEATRVREESWYAIRSTLTFTKGPVRIIGNVKGRQNWAYRMARKAEAGEEGYAFHRITAQDAVDAGLLDQKEIDDAKGALPEHIFNELYLCIPSDDGGNPFGLSAIAKCVVSDTTVATPVVWGVDLAKSQDWTVACGIDGDGHVVGLERWQSDWGATRTRLLSLLDGVPALIDSTGVGDPIVEDLQRKHGNITGFKFSSSSKQQIMEGLAAAIQRQEISFTEGWLSTELETFEYVYSRTGVKYSAPEGLHDDGVCALALAVRHKATAGCLQLGVRVIGGEADPVDDERFWQ